MNTDRELMQQALYALDAYRPVIVKRKGLTYSLGDKAIAALRERLAQPEQEPVACPDGKQCKHGAWCTETYCQEHCEFRAPPQRKPLTDEEIYKIANDLFYGSGPCDTLAMCRAIEAAHGITGEQHG